MGQQTAAPVAEQSYSKPAPPQPDPPQAHVDKTELDLEIEKYQKEIEDKQRRARSIQSSQAPQQQEQAPSPPPQQRSSFPAPQKGSYDVYDLPEADDQIPQFPPQQATDTSEIQVPADGEQPLYFTSVNTDRQRKKIKRPVNPKSKPPNTFLSKFFNKDKPQ